jgi:hypothetical protein
MVDIWLFHPKKFLNFDTFCSKEIVFGAFWLHAALKKNLDPSRWDLKPPLDQYPSRTILSSKTSSLPQMNKHLGKGQTKVQYPS